MNARKAIALDRDNAAINVAASEQTPPGPVPGTRVTEAYARMVARDIYFLGLADGQRLQPPAGLCGSEGARATRRCTPGGAAQPREHAVWQHEILTKGDQYANND